MLPEEFEQVCKAYAEQSEAESRGEWERVRWMAAITIQPHVKGKITPQRLLPLPWEKTQTPKQKPVGKEESKARFEALVKKLGSQETTKESAETH